MNAPTAPTLAVVFTVWTGLGWFIVGVPTSRSEWAWCIATHLLAVALIWRAW